MAFSVIKIQNENEQNQTHENRTYSFVHEGIIIIIITSINIF